MRTFLVFNDAGAVMEVREQEKEPAADEIQKGGIAVEFTPEDGDTNPANYTLIDGKLTHTPPKAES